MPLDPATAAMNMVSKLFDFLNSPVGQKFADRVFKDGEDLRATIDKWIHHGQDKAALPPAK